MAELKRTLGLTQCIFFGVGSILGAGIYTLIGKVAGVAGNMLWLSFLIASVTALFTAFSYAELSAAYPKSGGEYVYAKKAFGIRTGTFLGLIISLNGIVSGATVALGFAGYLKEFIPLELFVGSILIIVLLFLVNIAGIRESSTVNIVFTIIEIAGLVFVVFAAIPSIGEVNILEFPPGGSSGVLTAAALAFFAFIGFEEIVKLAEETKEPEKTIPRALIISSLIVMAVYTAVAISASSTVPFEQLAESDSPLAEIVGNRFGPAAVIAISIIALFSTSNTILSNMLGSSRVLLDMAKESKTFKIFSTISRKRQTPVAALILILFVMICFAAIGDIEMVARIAAMLIFVTFFTVNLAVIVLRKRRDAIRSPYRIPLNINNIPVISILGILMTMVLFVFNFIELLN